MPRNTAEDYVGVFDSINPNVRLVDITTNGTAIDLTNYDSATIRLAAANSGVAGALDVHIEESPDSTTWTDIPGAVFPQVLFGVNDATSYEGHIDLRHRNRFMRAVGVTSGNFFVYAVTFILTADDQPVAAREIASSFDIDVI